MSEKKKKAAVMSVVGVTALFLGLLLWFFLSGRFAFFRYRGVYPEDRFGLVSYDGSDNNVIVYKGKRYVYDASGVVCAENGGRNGELISWKDFRVFGVETCYSDSADDPCYIVTDRKDRQRLYLAEGYDPFDDVFSVRDTEIKIRLSDVISRTGTAINAKTYPDFPCVELTSEKYPYIKTVLTPVVFKGEYYLETPGFFCHKVTGEFMNIRKALSYDFGSGDAELSRALAGYRLKSVKMIGYGWRYVYEDGPFKLNVEITFRPIENAVAGAGAGAFNETELTGGKGKCYLGNKSGSCEVLFGDGEIVFDIYGDVFGWNELLKIARALS